MRRLHRLAPTLVLTLASALSAQAAGRPALSRAVGGHEHLYYPTGPGVYANLAESVTRLHLAGLIDSVRGRVGLF